MNAAKRTVVALYGRRGIGKSSIARLVQHKMNERGHSCVVISMAEPLRAVAEIILTEGGGLNWDEAGQSLHQHKDLPIRNLSGFSGRDLLLKVGDIFHHMNPDWRSAYLRRRISRSNSEIILIDDMRFPDEYDFVRKESGCVVFLRGGSTRPQPDGTHEGLLDDRTFNLTTDENSTWTERAGAVDRFILERMRRAR